MTPTQNLRRAACRALERLRRYSPSADVAVDLESAITTFDEETPTVKAENLEAVLREILAELPEAGDSIHRDTAEIIRTHAAALIALKLSEAVKELASIAESLASFDTNCVYSAGLRVQVEGH